MTKAKDKVLRTTAAKHLKPTNANEKGKTNKCANVQRQEDMQKPKWTQAFEESRSNNTLQQSLSPASDPADAQHGGSVQYNQNLVATSLQTLLFCIPRRCYVTDIASWKDKGKMQHILHYATFL